MFKKKIKDSPSVTDIQIGKIFYENKKNRLWLLLYRAVIMFMLVSGSIGCLLSSLSIPFDSLALMFWIAVASIFVSLTNYNRFCQNFGYAVFMLTVILIGYSLQVYITSGAHAIFNVFSDLASDYFSSNAMRNYGESVMNREKAVTISMSYVGAIVCILVNIYILRKMLYFFSTLVVTLIMFFPLYIEREPDFIYVVFIISSVAMIFIMYGSERNIIEPNDSLYSVKTEKRIIQINSKKPMFQSLIIVLSSLLAVCGIFFTVIPKDEYNAKRENSKLKENTMDSVENFTTMGIASLFNYYPNKGGLTNGRLGGINTVVLDYNPDLKITFAPYTNKRIYLKNFIGAEYLPFENRWRSVLDLYDETAFVLRDDYRSSADKENCAEGKMTVENIDAPPLPYLPYYTTETDKVVYQGRSQTYTFYPEFYDTPVELDVNDSDDLFVSYDSGHTENLQLYLSIPNINLSAVEEFCSNADLYNCKTQEEVIQKTINYYQENIPYSYQPGATPWRADFVNYFLTQNKKGYCAHFASAAVLIFRRMGIPARYVEGYAIDNADMLQTAELVENADISDYYNGKTDISRTAVISVNATDANAHAWVEVYDFSKGWQAVEVTPFSDKDYSQTEGLWSRFLRMLTSGATQLTENDSSPVDTSDYSETGLFSAKMITIIFSVIFIVVILYILAIRILQQRKYNQSTINDKLIINYSNFINKKIRKLSDLTAKTNYSSQLSYLSDMGILNISDEEKNRFYDILTRAGFSDKDISSDEFEWFSSVIKKL
ncbi:MAG: transglutaminase domain-containing protein [Firmicutes bacterium]|nr:transglutaminase domain-containing protein [Bacillota bacterium]